VKEIKPITESVRELPAVPQLQVIAPPPQDEEDAEEEDSVWEKLLISI